jgi:hypothetical protein
MSIIVRSVRLVFVFVMAVTLAPQVVRAEECKKPKVFFINGVLNTQWEAQDASRQLEAAIKSNGGPADLHITTLYNPTDTLLGDAIEVAQDYVLAENHLYLAFLAAMGADVITAIDIPLRIFLSWLTDDMIKERTYKQWLTDQVDGTAASLRNEDVISRIQRALRKELEINKTPVVVIAHSEGNFYLNEAIRRLKTNRDTKDIPGVQSIGVLGIGVASRLNPALLDSGSRLYRYVTKDDDIIINWLNGELRANFTNVVDDRLVSGTSTGHELVADYLYPNVKGDFDGVSGLSVRKVIAGEFVKIYDATSELFPCISQIAVKPDIIAADQPVALSAAVVSRSGVPTTGGFIAFTDGGATEYCASAMASNGIASCSFTFGSAAIPPQKIYAEWTYGVFRSSAATTNVTSAVSEPLTKVSNDGVDLPESAETWACVRHNDTGLMWEAHVRRSTGGANGPYIPHPCSWSSSETCTGFSNLGNMNPWDASYEESLQKSTVKCGRSGWRLPTEQEGRALVSHKAWSANTVAAYTKWFGAGVDDQEAVAWTSTLNNARPESDPFPCCAWYINFSVGTVSSSSRGNLFDTPTNNGMGVRLVAP